MANTLVAQLQFSGGSVITRSCWCGEWYDDGDNCFGDENKALLSDLVEEGEITTEGIYIVATPRNEVLNGEVFTLTEKPGTPKRFNIRSGMNLGQNIRRLHRWP